MLSLRTVSGRRYRIAGRLPSIHDDDFHRRLLDRRFLPLAAREEQAYGWVCADNLLLTRFDEDTVVRGDHAVFALRVDRRRVNPRLLRAQIELELDARVKAAEDGGRPRRPSRDERRQSRADLREALLRETNPSVQVCTVILHPKRKVLHVLTLGRTLAGLVVRVFTDTFGASLVPLTPWHRGGEILAGSSTAVPLAGLERTSFTAPPLPASGDSHPAPALFAASADDLEVEA